jgi:hypothetical protein
VLEGWTALFDNKWVPIDNMQTQAIAETLIADLYKKITEGNNMNELDLVADPMSASRICWMRLAISLTGSVYLHFFLPPTLSLQSNKITSINMCIHISERGSDGKSRTTYIFNVSLHVSRICGSTWWIGAQTHRAGPQGFSMGGAVKNVPVGEPSLFSAKRTPSECFR